MSTAAPRGTVCPLHSVTRTQLLTPQQRFDSIYTHTLTNTYGTTALLHSLMHFILVDHDVI